MGKRIVITGAGQGLGRALARLLGAQGHGVVLLGRTLAKVSTVAAEIGGASYALECDVASPASVNAAFAAIAERSGGVDVLVNNAATYYPSTVSESTDDQIAAAVTTNLSGPIHCARAAIPLMAAGAHIINVSSESVTMQHAMFSLYQSSKAGLERFSRALHDELLEDGIRVTMVRAGQMTDETTGMAMDMAAARRFAEANMRRGLDLRSRPTSSFDSVARLFAMLIDLPGEINVPELVIEARSV